MDKSTIHFQGEPLFLRSVRALHASGAGRVTVIGGTQPEVDTDVEFGWLPDKQPGAGPLAAVVHALDQAAEAHVVVLSCDLPAIRAREITLLVSCIGDADVALPVVGGHRQWMTSVWNVSARPELAGAVQRGEGSLWRAAPSLRTVLLFDHDDTGYMDVDTPDDLRVANTVRLSTQGRVGS
jgi:molybdopterin-guanine dinucleotide biosynthesis protein A